MDATHKSFISIMGGRRIFAIGNNITSVASIISTILQDKEVESKKFYLKHQIDSFKAEIHLMLFTFIWLIEKLHKGNIP